MKKKSEQQAQLVSTVMIDTTNNRVKLLQLLFPEDIIKRKNIYLILEYIRDNLEKDYQGIAYHFDNSFKKTKNSDLLDTIFTNDGLKPTDNIQKSAINRLMLGGNTEKLYSGLLEIPEIQNALDNFIQRNSESLFKKFSSIMLVTINNESSLPVHAEKNLKKEIMKDFPL